MGNTAVLWKVEAQKKSGWLAAALNLAGYISCGSSVLGIVAFVFVVALVAPKAYADQTLPVCVSQNSGHVRVVASAADCRAPEVFLNLATPETKPNVVGAWFGIARPCPPPAGDTSPEHASFCTEVCGLCPNTGILPPEVVLMATLKSDGTMAMDDAAEISLYHTPAHGQWTTSAGDGLPERAGTDRFKGTALWLGQTPPAFNQLGNAVRVRFVTYSDPLDPDRMLGFIQPYFFPIATGGTVIVNPASPTDELASNHVPTIDPLTTPLPAGCDLSKGCLGTYHFFIRRIQAQ